MHTLCSPLRIHTIVVTPARQSALSRPVSQDARQKLSATIYDFRLILGLIASKIPTPNAATRVLQHRSVAVGPQRELPHIQPESLMDLGADSEDCFWAENIYSVCIGIYDVAIMIVRYASMFGMHACAHACRQVQVIIMFQ